MKNLYKIMKKLYIYKKNDIALFIKSGNLLSKSARVILCQVSTNITKWEVV